MNAARAAVFRELLRRELGERIRGSLLGAAWHALLPLLQFAVLALVFGALLAPRGEAGAVPYPVFLALGLWPWYVFANALGRAATALTDNAALIGKTTVAPADLVGSRVLASALQDAGGYLLVLAVIALSGVRLHPLGLLAMWPALLALALFAQALGLLAAHLQVFLRDTATVLGQLLVLGFFLTPVLYPPGVLEAVWWPLAGLNPFAGLVDGSRTAWLDGTFHSGAWAYAMACLAFACGLAWSVTRRLRPLLEDGL
jgi:lipopolysaccharide transport system permease protein